MKKHIFQFERQILASAKDIERRIVFSDGNDIRLAYALKTFLNLNNSQCIMLGNEKEGSIGSMIKERLGNG
jgi:phosphotransacetylase